MIVLLGSPIAYALIDIFTPPVKKTKGYDY